MGRIGQSAGLTTVDVDSLVVGITGNIGVGKSTVLKLLAAKGASIIDMDQITRQALHSAGPGYLPVVEAFGRGILQASGEIDRSRLGRIVFGDAARLAALEGILHPIVFEMVKTELAQRKAPLVAIEAVKLLEAGTTRRLCDQIWVVTAAPEAQLQRLIEQRGMHEADVRRRMAQQTSEAWKVAQADRVIANSGTERELALQIDRIWAAVVGAAA